MLLVTKELNMYSCKLDLSNLPTCFSFGSLPFRTSKRQPLVKLLPSPARTANFAEERQPGAGFLLSTVWEMFGWAPIILSTCAAEYSDVPLEDSGKLGSVDYNRYIPYLRLT